MHPKIKKAILYVYWHTKYFFILRIRRMKGILWGRKPKDLKKIPIIINNYNQLDYLKRLIDALEKRGYSNIYIIDNASTYPPLLEYYMHCPYTVYKLKDNLGYLALWKSGLFELFKRDYFVYTDPDVEPVEECPDDFMERFYNLMRKYKYSAKVGFSLRISDLPDCFGNKQKVIEWESKFWKKEAEPNVYKAPIDTTFALHRPFTFSTSREEEKMLRVGEPYTLRHLPWYVDPDNMSENMKYYIEKSQQSTHWTQNMKSDKSKSLKQGNDEN